MSVLALGGGRSNSRKVPISPAPYSEWAFVNKRPNSSDGVLNLPFTEDGLYRFEPPSAVSACKAVTLGGAADGCPPDPEKIISELNVNWGDAKARQSGRALVCSLGHRQSPAYTDCWNAHSINVRRRILSRFITPERLDRLARGGRLFEVLRLDPGAFETFSGSVGCVRQRINWRLRAT